MIKRLIYILPIVLLAISCGGETEESKEDERAIGHVIKGEVGGTGGDGVWVKLAVFEGGEEKMIDSTVIKNGVFELSTITKEMREYILFIGDNEMPIVLFLDENSPEVTLRGSLPGFGLDYSVQGSEFSTDVVDYLAYLDRFRDKEYELYANLPVAEPNGKINPTDTVKYNEVMASLDSISLIKKDYAIAYIMEKPASPVGWVMLREMFPPSGLGAFDTADLKYFDMVAEGLRDAYPYSEYPSFIESDMESISYQLAALNQPALDIAPDILLNDMNGKVLPLSSLRGQVVLLDFWASWCRPCRAENPNVVRLYDKYKDKGFTVYSVSLDNSRDAWLKAIDEDNLSWSNHVSDLKGWQCEGAAIYGVTQIPTTYLIDKDGKIIAKDLRGIDLERKLEEIFG